MAGTSRLITEAMLKEAADGVNRHSTLVTAEVSSHHGWPALILTLNDAPHTELVAHVRDKD